MRQIIPVVFHPGLTVIGSFPLAFAKQESSLIELRICPLLPQVKEHYSDVAVYVMANGVQEDPARFKDTLRVYYLYNYINEALKGEATV